ncbi:MAG: sigma-70 family RNA polymerase sigma factor [Oscillospiraceae bacterium]|nr:sigma-70 family RNA polymerase sigma factor [Oscillospiraceae bacterium]
MTEATALLRLQHGKEDALAWFIEKYTPYVCTVIRYIIGESMTEEDVEETASDVFLVLWKESDRVCLATVRPWLGSVARNKARQKLRERDMTLPLEEDLLLPDGTNLEQRMEQAERDRLVREAVYAMDPTDREIFLRYYYHCQPIAEIAKELRTPASTVKSRLRRGREKLRAALERKL